MRTTLSKPPKRLMARLIQQGMSLERVVQLVIFARHFSHYRAGQWAKAVFKITFQDRKKAPE